MERVNLNGFCFWLRKILKEKGITQLEFASRVGVSDREVGRWVSGASFPTIQMLEKILCVLDYHLEYVENKY